jgi:hypothetical protein
VRKVDHDTEPFAFAHQISAECGQAVPRGAARFENAAAARGIAPGMRQSDHPQAEFVKYPEQIQILAQRLNTFHGDDQSNFARRPRARDFVIALANGQALCVSHLGIQACDLVEADTQSHLGQITVLYINGDSQQANVSRLEFRQKMRHQHTGPVALLIQIDQQIEMKIDHAIRM